MVSGGEAGGGGGKKRKASSAAEDMTSAAVAARREPRRGLGVAELERIRLALEMAERCYAAAAAASSTLSAAAPPQHHPPPALPLVAHAAGGVAAAPAHHQHVGNGAAAHHLQMARGYLTPYCLAQHYYANDSLTRLFTTKNDGHPSSNQNHHFSNQKHYRRAHQIQSSVTALPVMGQAASSESSSSASQRQGPRRRKQAKPGQTTAALPQVAFVDLVDSDDDTASGEVEELDLELKL